MRQDFKHRLITWKSDVHAGEIKKVYVSENPVKTGEYLVKLEKSMRGSFGENKKDVKVSRKYLTAAQRDEKVDPASDMYHINRMIDSLDREFDDTYDQTVNELFKDEAVRFSEI